MLAFQQLKFLVFRVYLLSEKFSILRLKLSGRNFESESFAAIVDAGVKKLENKLECLEKKLDLELTLEGLT